MDNVLSEFIARTAAAPGLATDLLNAHEWNLQNALASYYVMKGILPGEVPVHSETSSPQSSSVISNQNAFSSKENTSCSSSNSQNCNKELDDITDDEDICKKLTRGFSRAMDNVGLISRARSEFAHDFGTLTSDDSTLPTKLEIPDYTFTLPNFSAYHPSLREYLQKDLIETSTLVSLEETGHLNWWYTKKICQKLWPLATTGDGNCLLHAASLGMWGFHDRLLTLRKALHSILTSGPFTGAFYRRWRWQTALQNKEAGLIYCEEEWEREWQNLLKMSSTEPRTKHLQSNSFESHTSMQDSNCEKLSNVYESLEELHVFGLAHVLMRPIIVIADTMLKDVAGEPFAPIPFSGIYLPLECPPSECHRSPLCLTYDSAHFSALVPMDADASDPSPLKAAIPVIGLDHTILPLHFAVDPGAEVQWGHDENDPWVVGRLSLTDKDKLILLNEYLDIRSLPVTCSTDNCYIEPQKTVNNYVADNNNSELRYDDSDDDREGGISCTGGRHNKSKAAKQLQTVAKQFGSIGKSVSKKLKHIGDIARRGGSFKGDSKSLRQTSGDLKNKRNLSGLPMLSCNSSVNGNCNPHQAIVALLHTEKKHEYQKEMIQNYLCSAVLRFEEAEVLKANLALRNNKVSTAPSKCLNYNCLMYGSSSTNYLCSACYAEKNESKLKKEKSQDVLTFGKSSFYTESDKATVKSLDKVPIARGFSGKSCLRWTESDYYDKYPSARPSTFPYDYKRKPLCLDDTVILNTLQESASS